MLNRVVLIGMVGKSGIELRYSQTGKAVAKFSLGVKRPFKNQNGENEWDNVNIVVWGPQAESCSQYLGPSKMAAADGRLQIRSYDGDDGQKRWITEVIAESVRFLSPKEQTIIPESELPELNF